MSVTDADDRLLLARGAEWPEGRFSVLAGFLEPGESLEAAVAREVREEVGLEVEDVTFLGNQPWPFPTSLMVGFTARAAGSAIELDGDEIAEAFWVTREGLAERIADGRVLVSSRMSISHRLMERWYGQPLPTSGEWRPARG
jgi:NAD+ diphosphatase